MAITAARIAVWSTMGPTIGAVMMVSGGLSENASESQTEQMHQNADSKESEEKVSETSLQSEAVSSSTQGDEQTTTTTSVLTRNRSNTFMFLYSKESEESSSADQTKER